jgi:hypothetical protein
MRTAYKILVRKPEWKHFGCIVIDERIILKLILKEIRSNSVDLINQVEDKDQ